MGVIINNSEKVVYYDEDAYVNYEIDFSYAVEAIEWIKKEGFTTKVRCVGYNTFTVAALSSSDLSWVECFAASKYEDEAGTVYEVGATCHQNCISCKRNLTTKCIIVSAYASLDELFFYCQFCELTTLGLNN